MSPAFKADHWKPMVTSRAPLPKDWMRPVLVTGLRTLALHDQTILLSTTRLTISAIKPYVGFSVDDYRIRGLMRFIKMISME
jgi:hypothetical protein